MTEFQLHFSGVRSDCSSNSATSTAQFVACFINIQLDFKLRTRFWRSELLLSQAMVRSKLSRFKNSKIIIILRNVTAYCANHTKWKRTINKKIFLKFADWVKIILTKMGQLFVWLKNDINVTTEIKCLLNIAKGLFKNIYKLFTCQIIFYICNKEKMFKSSRVSGQSYKTFYAHKLRL